MFNAGSDPADLLITPLLGSSGLNGYMSIAPRPFPDFAPRLLASLVASSTAACTSGVVTVTAASHGIPATTFDGLEFYYPGSPSLVAGWYSGFSRTGSSTITFSAPLSANFASESVNSGAAFTSEMTLATLTLPGNTLLPGNLATASIARVGDNVSSAKTIRLKLGATTLASHAPFSSCGSVDLSFCAVSSSSQIGHANVVGTTVATALTGSVDLTAAQVISLTGQHAGAGQYLYIAAAKFWIK